MDKYDSGGHPYAETLVKENVALRAEVERLRVERVDEGKVWAACPRCAKLRAEVERLKEEWRIQAETALKWLGRIKQLEDAVEWAIDTIDWDDAAVLKEMTGIGDIDADEQAYLDRRRAGRG